MNFIKEKEIINNIFDDIIKQAHSKRYTYSISAELAIFINTLARASNKPTEEFLEGFIEHGIKSYNQTEIEWLKTPDSNKPGRCIFMYLNPTALEENGFLRKTVVDGVEYTDACKMAHKTKCQCFKWMPYSIVNQEKESDGKAE